MNYVDGHISDDFAGVPSQRLEEDTEKGHGRMDSRTYLQFEVPNTFTATSRWKGAEDDRCGCLSERLAWLRRFNSSLLKQHPGKDGLAMKRRICGWNDHFLMQVLGIKAI